MQSVVAFHSPSIHASMPRCSEMVETQSTHWLAKHEAEYTYYESKSLGMNMPCTCKARAAQDLPKYCYNVRVQQENQISSYQRGRNYPSNTAQHHIIWRNSQLNTKICSFSDLLTRSNFGILHHHHHTKKHHHSWLGNIRLAVATTNLLEQEADLLLSQKQFKYLC